MDECSVRRTNQHERPKGKTLDNDELNVEYEL